MKWNVMKKPIAMLCAVVLLLGICQTALAAGVPAFGNIDSDRVDLYYDKEQDIKVMSVNVLAYENKDNAVNGENYDSLLKRAETLEKMVWAYEPDIILFQEAISSANIAKFPATYNGQDTKNAEGELIYDEWARRLKRMFYYRDDKANGITAKKGGYAYLSVFTENKHEIGEDGKPILAGIDMGDINTGLLIYWKADRFYTSGENTHGDDCGASLYKYTSDDDGTYRETITDKDGNQHIYDVKVTSEKPSATIASGSILEKRAYMYTTLKDNKNNHQELVIFNTHLSYNPTQAKYTKKDKTTGKETTNESSTFSESIYDANGRKIDLSEYQQKLGQKIRNAQIIELKAAMEKAAQGRPLICGGDFNETYSDCYDSIGNAIQLNTVNGSLEDASLLKLANDKLSADTAASPYYDAARMARQQVNVSYKTTRDHIFVNDHFWDIAAARFVRDGYHGSTNSDHAPLLTTLCYRPKVDITSPTTMTFRTETRGTGDSKEEYDREFSTLDYDTSTGIVTDTTDVQNYTLNIELGKTFPLPVSKTASPFTRLEVEYNDTTTQYTPATYTAKRVENDELNSSYSFKGYQIKDLQLLNTDNEILLKFYRSGDTEPYDTIIANIHYTALDKPILQVEHAVNHYYGAGAYHVVLEGAQEDVIIRPINGTLYKDAACSEKLEEHIYDVLPGRTPYFIEASNSADIYPLYIYRETKPASQDPKVVYIDDDFGNATGTVAFWDGEDGISLVTADVNGYDCLNDLTDGKAKHAVNVNSADGYTVYVAPGQYDWYYSQSNETYHRLNWTPFRTDITILGPNYAVPANYRDVDGTWTMSTDEKLRLPEAELNGMLYFQHANSSYNKGNADGESNKTKKLTVRGFSFTGKTTNASINVEDIRNGGALTKTDDNEDWAVINRTGHTTEFDIQNNFFTASGFHFNAAAISANTSTQKKGVISGNYFKAFAFRTLDEEAARSNVTQNKVNDFYRAIFMRNLNGIELDGNRFVDINVPFWFSSEIQDTKQHAYGNCTFTCQGNRFENCGEPAITATALEKGKDNNHADIQFLQNDFIRCGAPTTGAPISINLTEFRYGTGTNKRTVETDYSKVTVRIWANSFYDCYQSIRIYRSSYSRQLNSEGVYESVRYEHLGDLSYMNLYINENRFVNPLQHGTKATSQRQTIKLNFYLNADDAGTVDAEGNYTKVDNTARTKATDSPKWNFTRNYFTTRNANDETDTTTGQNPVDFIENKRHNWDPEGDVSVNDGVSVYFADWDTQQWSPYYTSYDWQNLSTDVEVGNAYKDVTATAYSEEYDGEAHGITMNGVPKNGLVTYSLNEEGYEVPAANASAEKWDAFYEQLHYTVHVPTRVGVTNGQVPVYWCVSGYGNEDTYGTSYIEIKKKANRNVGNLSQTVTYTYGKTYSITPYKAEDVEDRITYIYNGIEYKAPPQFSDVGTYKITLKVNNINYEDFEQEYTLVINQAEIAATAAGFDISYDGKEHTPTISNCPEDVIVEYSYDGGAHWTKEKPGYTYPTGETAIPIKVRFSGTNYKNVVTNDITVKIEPATIGAKMTTHTLTANGWWLNGVDVTEITTVNDGNDYSIQYSKNGGALQKDEPGFMTPGTYSIAAVITKPYHYDKVLTGTVVVNESNVGFGYTDLVLEQAKVYNQNIKDMKDEEGNTKFDKYDYSFLRYVDSLSANKFSLVYNIQLAMSDKGISEAASSQDFKILAFGLKYASSSAKLEQYAFYKKHYDANVATLNDTESTLTEDEKAALKSRNSEIEKAMKGLATEYLHGDCKWGAPTKLYKNNPYHIYNVNPFTARYAMTFVRYEVNGEVYEEYSNICAASTLLGDDNSDLEDWNSADNSGNVESQFISGIAPTKTFGEAAAN